MFAHEIPNCFSMFAKMQQKAFCNKSDISGYVTRFPGSETIRGKRTITGKYVFNNGEKEKFLFQSETIQQLESQWKWERPQLYYKPSKIRL